MKHTPRKRFGQNFLQDEYIISKIIECINPQKTDTLVEIGPGLAALTKPLLNCIDHIHVVEIDRDIISYLKSRFEAKQLTIHEGDALQFNFNLNNEKIRIVGNLPYNISTPLLFHLANIPNIVDMYFMLQKEVVDRICAKSNSSDYGRLTIMLQAKFDCKKLLDVSPECFYPAPKVNSAIVKLVPRTDLVLNSDEINKLNQVVTQAFSQRRKTISNSLKLLVPKDKLVALNIDLTKRAENLTIVDYLSLSRIV